LIKFKTPVRSVSVTTLGEDKNGVAFARMGDQPARKSTATETLPVSIPVNAATQVQTIVDMKPTEEAQAKPGKEKIEIRDLISEPVHQIKIHDLLSTPALPAEQKVEPTKSEAIAIPKSESAAALNSLDAHFIRDTISDGSKVVAESQFVQVWTLRNPGPKAWPAGCSVRHVGGDNMLNLDNTQPLSQNELAEASESNVIGRPVEVGEEISFRVVLKAPKREGTAISYWRLKGADGTPFGHRLWCDIQVVAPPCPASPSPVSQPSPPLLWSTSEEVPQSSASASSSGSTHLDSARHRAHGRLDLKRLAEARARAQKKMLQKEADSSPAGRIRVDAERAERAKLLQARRKAVERLFEAQVSTFPQIDEDTRERLDAVAHSRPDFPYNALSRLATALSEPRVEASFAEAAEAIKDVIVKEESTEEEAIKEEPQAEEAVQYEAASETQTQSSTMIFPQLDKESPASSTHEASAVKAPEETKSDAVPAADSSEDDEGDFFEDAESVEILNASSDDDASFLTDEEYDILDASDEEMP
jgi:next-to-BRCA1 protein 1